MSEHRRTLIFSAAISPPLLYAVLILLYAYRHPDAPEATQALLTVPFMVMCGAAYEVVFSGGLARYKEEGRPLVPLQRLQVAIRWLWWPAAACVLALGVGSCQSLLLNVFRLSASAVSTVGALLALHACLLILKEELGYRRASRGPGNARPHGG